MRTSTTCQSLALSLACSLVLSACGQDGVDAGSSYTPETGARGATASTGPTAEPPAEVEVPAPEPEAPQVEPTPEPLPVAPAPSGRLVYPVQQVFSPITAELADRLRAIVSNHPSAADAVFSKIGASSTVSSHFMHCFAGSGVAWAGFGDLEPTRQFFLAGVAGSTNPYVRASLSATSGWSAVTALAGSPSPYQQELTAANPRFAHVAYGTNDIGLNKPDRFADNMFSIVDRALQRGTIPWLSTILPRLDSTSANAQVPFYNAIIRAVAQSRGVPLLDYYHASSSLPGWGMAADGIHPRVYSSGGAKPCDFGSDGLKFGYNTRNLISMQMLDRLKRFVLDGEDAPDAAPALITGQGTQGDPYVVPGLPFVDAQDTRNSTSRVIDSYPGCNATQNESGAEFFYRFEVTANTEIVATVHSRTGADIDIHLLGEDPDPAQCIARAHQKITRTLTPGTYYLVLDTFVEDGGGDLAGEFVVSILAQ